MNNINATKLSPPRYDELGKLSIVGISRNYAFQNVADIPDQWQSFGPLIPQLSAVANAVAYGVIYNPTDENFDYLSGVDLTDVPELY